MATIPENSTKRFERYEAAKTKMLQWRNLLQQTYDYTLPGRVNFNKELPGTIRSEHIFDDTAVQSLKMFANNIQSILMPPGRQWAIFKPGVFQDLLNKDEDKLQVQKDLESATRIFFNYLQSSNFDQVVNSALQDMAVSTGIILLNEGDSENPFIFNAVSIDEVAFEKNESTGTIENIWRCWKVPFRQIERLWPQATIPESLTQQLQNRPDEKIKVIEGTIYYEKEKKWWYYVQLEDSKTDLYSDEREYNPWTAFRWNVRTGETVGYGPAMELLSTIRVLNTVSELELKAANLKAYPPYIGIDTKTWNVNFARIEPASIVKVGPEFMQNDPLRPIPTNGDPQFTQLLVEKLQNVIRESLFANPLPPLSSPRMTATEVATRQQDWIRSSGTAISRLMVELLEPLIKKCVMILKKLGLFPDIKLDGKHVDIKYDSPLILLQGEEDFERIERYVQFFAQMGGPEIALALTKLEELPTLVSDFLGVDKRIVPSPADVQAIEERLQQAAQRAITPQAVGGVPTMQQQQQQQPQQAQVVNQ